MKSIGFIGGVVMTLGTLGCTAPSPTAKTEPAKAAAPVAPPPAAPAAPAAAAPAAWIGVSDGKVHALPEAPKGLYVAGKSTGGAFEPEGGVQGEGTLGAPGQAGWLDLKSGAFHSDVESVAPIKPYLRGSKAADGSFSPGSREVVR